MKVLGVGWPRTGTTSLRHALEQLGFGPCHHMMTLNGAPERISLWEAAEHGDVTALRAACDGYAAAVDNPVCSLWRPLTEAFPDAKVILSVREPHSWYGSYIEAIHRHTFGSVPPPAAQRTVELLRRVWLHGMLADRADDEAACVEAFERHQRDVVHALGDRVLVYEASMGWEPLCAHLDVPVPRAPFPHKNARARIRERGGHEV